MSKSICVVRVIYLVWALNPNAAQVSGIACKIQGPVQYQLVETISNRVKQESTSLTCTVRLRI